MIISVASGKGGTGKTTVAAALARSLGGVQLLDCDVEEPNAHLFLKPEITKKKDACVPVPAVDGTKCTFCGKCAEVCEYNAIAVLPGSGKADGKVLIFPELCHSCGACALLCPAVAITEIERQIGQIESGDAREVKFCHGRLNIGEAVSPPLIRQVKKLADALKTVIIDAPPGTSCPVVAAVKGSDYCLLVTEPTPFGLNDLALAVGMVRKMGIPFGVVINRDGTGDSKTEEYCVSEKIDVLMKIPFSREIAKAYSRGEILTDAFPEFKQAFRKAYEKICMAIKKK